MIDLRSNPERQFKIGWPGWFAGDVGGGTRRSSLFRSGAARSSPEFTVSGPPGVNPNWIWVRKDQRGMRSRPRALAKGCRGRSIGRSSGGGATVAKLAGVRVQATPGLGTRVKRVRGLRVAVTGLGTACVGFCYVAASSPR